MPGDDAHNRDIIFGEAERRGCRGTAEPRTAHRLLNRNALHMPELYQALGRGRPRQGGIVRGASGPFGADRDSSDETRSMAASLLSTRIRRMSRAVARITTEVIEGSGGASECSEARESPAIAIRDRSARV